MDRKQLHRTSNSMSFGQAQGRQLSFMKMAAGSIVMTLPAASRNG